MPEADVAAMQFVHAMFVATPLVLILIGYIVYRLVKERKRRLARQTYTEENRTIDENWFAK